MRGESRGELLLPLACAGASAMLAAAQFMDMFHLTPPGGEALRAVTSQDQHGYAMLVLAVLALVLAIVWAVGARSSEGGAKGGRQVAAFGIAAAGVVALLLFLTVDLPDVNKIGTLDDERGSFIDAKAEPQAGFWLTLVGSIVLAACGIALATLRPSAERERERAAQPIGRSEPTTGRPPEREDGERAKQAERPPSERQLW